MNKQKELKSLTWKYFWQQKILEIGSVAIILIMLTILPYNLGLYIGDNLYCSNPSTEGINREAPGIRPDISNCGDYPADIIKEQSIIEMWLEGIGYMGISLIGLLVIAGIVLIIIILLVKWIDSNWKLATKRAKKELKIK